MVEKFSQWTALVRSTTGQALANQSPVVVRFARPTLVFRQQRQMSGIGTGPLQSLHRPMSDSLGLMWANTTVM